ncbi:MAG: response regulator, partial [Gammaproteobacteria bacterium]
MNIASCYFPTQTLILDDNPRFLESMNVALSANHIVKSFKTPIDLIDYVTQTESVPFSQHCLHRPEEAQINHRIIDVDVDAIQKEVYNPKRFFENTVLVVDYAMPSMHGLDVCKELRHFPIKKIMLTGEADDTIAVEAFNQGLIHK